MRIENIRVEPNGARTRLAANVIWEESQRPAQAIYFETTAPYAAALSCDANAFLTAAVLPAMRHGEKRVAAQGEVCPQLKAGLQTALNLIHHWYGSVNGEPVIEAKTMPGLNPVRPPTDRTAFFLTGGMDSLATLRSNRLAFPREHPGSIKDGVLIFGLEVSDPQVFENVAGLLAGLAEADEFNLIPVYTNVRSLDEDWVFWGDQFEAAVLSSAVHALGRRLTAALIGSSFDYPYLHPHGSHPLLDSNYSSYSLRVHHDGVALSRLDKARLLADWDLAFSYLRVCNENQSVKAGIVNCGRCEKCLRTLAELHVLGKVDLANTFAARELTPELIRARVYLSPTNFPFWDELVTPLEKMGEPELAQAVRSVIRQYRGETGWMGSLKAFDRQYLQGSLRQLKKALAGGRTLGHACRLLSLGLVSS